MLRTLCDPPSAAYHRKESAREAPRCVGKMARESAPVPARTGAVQSGREPHRTYRRGAPRREQVAGDRRETPACRGAERQGARPSAPVELPPISADLSGSERRPAMKRLFLLGRPPHLAHDRGRGLHHDELQRVRNHATHSWRRTGRRSLPAVGAGKGGGAWRGRAAGRAKGSVDACVRDGSRVVTHPLAKVERGTARWCMSPTREARRAPSPI